MYYRYVYECIKPSPMKSAISIAFPSSKYKRIFNNIRLYLEGGKAIEITLFVPRVEIQL